MPVYFTPTLAPLNLAEHTPSFKTAVLGLCRMRVSRQERLGIVDYSTNVMVDLDKGTLPAMALTCYNTNDMANQNVGNKD